MKITQFLSALWLLPALLMACNSGGAAPNALSAEDLATRDSVISVLRQADPSAFRSVFTRIPDYAYTRHLRTVQLNDQDILVASLAQTIRYEPQEDAPMATVEHTDSTGGFDYGIFKRFADATVTTDHPGDIASYVFPEDPSYLSSRNLDHFSYQFLPDTLLWNHSIRVLEIRALPGEGADQAVRHARFYIDRTTETLVGVSQERVDQSVLFGEASQFVVRLRPLPTGEWGLHTTQYDAQIKTFFHDPTHFRVNSTYYAYAR